VGSGSDGVMRRVARCVGRLATAVAALGAPALGAQGWPVSPAGVPLQSIAERRFDAASGLHATTAFAMAADRRGEPWLAADDGVYRYTSGAWVRVALPPEFANQQVRALLITRDDTKWLGTRRGVLRVGPTGATDIFREADGLPGPVAYGLVETRALDGSPRIVAGTSRGVAWFDGRRFVPLAMPAPATWVGVMVADARDARGGAVLWAANAAGGVARYAQGAWRT
jgi:two-component system, cell cycle sensor histidine kinase and response regulator CckA